MGRTILHCDMNNFYASVECMLNMKLRDKPVAVGGDVENRHGIILAKNYHAKKYGIQTGEALWQAQQKCRDLIIVPPHYEEYLKYSKLAREIYSQYTDLIEPYGMDECWLDVTSSRNVSGNGEEIANKLRKQMYFELGLTISVGVSFNKIFAKLGSDMKKPNATTVIPEDTFREKIWHLPASDMLGVGRATEKVLNSYCINTIGDLAHAPRELLKRRLGKCGEMIIDYANGQDHSRVAPFDYEPPIKSVGHGITTKEDLVNPAEVWNVMLSLVQDIGHKLRVYNKKAGGVAIYIRNNQLESRQCQCQLPVKTYSSAVIAKAAFDLFARSYVWNNDIRSVTVRAINLTSQSEAEQLTLFSDATEVQKRERLEDTIESIRDRFGKNAILPATLIEPKRSFVVDKAKHKQKRVAAYCRVSTDSDEQLTSYENQMKVYTEYINSNKDWEFAGLYADEGISGTRADKRPEFKRMIEDCLKGKIDHIITKCVSRFARNTVECLEYVRMLRSKGISVYFEKQNIDTMKNDSELYLVIYAGFAQSESESISKNITWTYRKNFEEGKPIYMYKKWLGYKKGEDGIPEIIPYEAKVVERISAS